MAAGSHVAIRAENLGKSYRIGARQGRQDTLRDTIAGLGLRIAALNKRNPAQGSRNSNYDTIWALKDVSFEVRLGEVVGIIGRNGAGKSTLLKILSRITEPTTGCAAIHGRVGSLLEVGTGFHPELTGRENIYLNGAILGMRKSEIERKFDEIVAFAEIEKFLDTPVKRYSSGMYVRLAFAVAAHLEPEILLVDEVLAVGDAAFQRKCLGKMGDVAKEGRTVVLVSHNMFSLQNLCTKGVLLDAGQVSMEGPIASVIDKYLDFGGEQVGEINWPSPDVAPGDERARLKAVRIVSDGRVTGDPDISKEFRIEVEYWNSEANSRRLVSVHIHNAMGICVLTSGNLPSASLTEDPWYACPYPTGLFRTTCVIPGDLLNDGPHSVSIYINENNLPRITENDNIIVVNNMISFNVQDSGTMRREYVGKWVGAVRPRLNWQTMQLS